ncbi:MAG TPA: hypothetical protein VF316_17390 [Polyangiaceae bacterium]
MRDLKQLMATRRRVRLADGRTGIIVRIDTTFPAGDETVEVWTTENGKPGLSKVKATSVLGAVKEAG